jgi:hypothetical protein
MSFITAITLLTGYYAIIFVGFFGIYIIYLRLQKQRDINEILVYVSLFIAESFLPSCFIQGIFLDSYRIGQTKLRGRSLMVSRKT